jgi:probable phosphoglycerate mutase
MTTIWLTRHAESADPTVFHGAESDIGLSDPGRQQAEAAAAWFAHLSPNAVVSSAMARAVQTAAPIARACGVPHHLEPALHERRVGELSGASFSSHSGPWHDTIHYWMAGDIHYTTPGAESFHDLRARLMPAFERLGARFANRRLVVVAHGVVCKVLHLCLLPGLTPANWDKLGRVANLAVSEFQFDGLVWQSARLLEVPPPVAALAESAAPLASERSAG